MSFATATNYFIYDYDPNDGSDERTFKHRLQNQLDGHKVSPQNLLEVTKQLSLTGGFCAFNDGILTYKQWIKIVVSQLQAITTHFNETI